MKIFTNRNVAFGNGTRPKGFLLGESTAESFDLVTVENTTLAEGVSDVELRHAMINPEMITSVGPEMSVPNLVDPVYNPPVATSPSMEELDAENESDSNTDLYVSDEIRAKPVSDLKPPKAVAKLLADGGITTVGELIDYADSHEGLTSLGLTEEQDAEAAAAIDKLLTK